MRSKKDVDFSTHQKALVLRLNKRLGDNFPSNDQRVLKIKFFYVVKEKRKLKLPSFLMKGEDERIFT